MKQTIKVAGVVALTAISGAVHAQAASNVQLYGVIDIAVERVSNSPTGSVMRMPNLSGGLLPSRWGLRGTEDLGGGLSAVYTLEAGFQPDNGGLGQGNRAFGRQSWVGLAGPWGTVTAGRTYSFLTFSSFDVDVIGPSQIAFSNFDGYLPNARFDNSIAYRGTFRGFTVGANYSLGRDVSAAGGPAATNCPGESATDRKACTGWSAMLRYDDKTWGAVIANDTYRGGTGAAAAFSPTRSDQSDTRTHLAGYVWLGKVKIGGGWLRRDNEASATTPRSDLGYLGFTWKDAAPALDIDAQVSRLDVKNSPNQGTLLALRGTYNLSKRTAVYVMYGRMDNDGTLAAPVSAGAAVAPGGTQSSVLAGIKHSF